MSSPASLETPTPSPGERRPRPSHQRKVVAVSLGIAALALGTAALLVHRFWPFQRAAILQDLSEASDSSVEIRGFRTTYFPFPGCVLDGAVFHHGEKSKRPLITIERLTIRGSYLGIFTHHVERIIADGGHVFVPAFGSGVHFHTQHSRIVVNEVIANGTVVEFESRDPNKKALRFDIHEGSVRNVGWNGPLDYRLKLHNPMPPGEIEATGKFGGWRKDDPGETPFSGEYKFTDADLHVFGGIAGKLSSGGKFGGVLKHLDVTGSTDVPDFEVSSGGHKVQLMTEFSAYVNGINGDTFLSRVDAHFRRTHVVAQGSIAKVKGRKGKTALIDLQSPHGRIEDVLGLFVKAPRAPMSGPMAVKAKVEIPPGEEEFLKKVKLQGVFGVEEGSFTKFETQQDVDKLSAGARGQNKEDAETVMTDLTGEVLLENGTANFTDLRFQIPGTKAKLNGTYNIINHKIDLHGRMKVQTAISNTSSGVKSLLLKVMDPFFKKKKDGEVVPVHIGGTYERPEFGLDLRGKKQRSVKLGEPQTNPSPQ
jgi:AsmA-like C-terminal region